MFDMSVPRPITWPDTSYETSPRVTPQGSNRQTQSDTPKNDLIPDVSNLS